MKNGKKHGTEYDWIIPGVLAAAEPFVDGVCHGTVRQWNDQGRSIGTYRMVHGTGLDLWRQQRTNRSVCLSEVAYCKNGAFHGFIWRLEQNQTAVWSECHCQNGLPHGIEREWNPMRRLCRGYPKYHVLGNAVTKRQYLKATTADPTLPKKPTSAMMPGGIGSASLTRPRIRTSAGATRPM